MAPPSAQPHMALVPVPSHRLLLVDAPALSTPRVVLMGAGVPLPAGVRAVATVNRGLESFIAHSRSPRITSGLGLGGSSGHAAGSNPRMGRASRSSALRTYGLRLSGDSSLRLDNVLALAAPGSTLLESRLGLGDYTGRYGSAITTKALGGSGSSVGYTGEADDEAKLRTDQVTQILRMRAKLAVMIDEVPTDSRSALRALIRDVNKVDLAVPVYHWVVPRLQRRLRDLLGEEVHSWTIEMDVKLHELSDVQKLLMNAASYTISDICHLKAQIYYTLMHADATKASLPFDHVLYDVTPSFLDMLSDIEFMFHQNIDLLGFTRKAPVTLQQLCASHARALLLAFEAVVEYRGVVNAALIDANRMVMPKGGPDPAVLVKELKKDYSKLLSEEYQLLDYMLGPCEGHVTAVRQSLLKLQKDLRPLRLRD